MNPLAIFTVLAKAGAVLKFGKILWALPKFYSFAKKFGPVAGDIIKNQKLPNGKQSQEFLRATAALLRTEVIDFPGVDEELLAQKFETLALDIDLESEAA